MEGIIEQLLVGKWRSFKTFKYTGRINFSNRTSFLEIDVFKDGMLLIKEYKEGAAKELTRTDKWTIVFNNKKHYVKIQDKLEYQVITVNHTILVLGHTTSSDKIFCSKESLWDSYLQSNKHPLL